MHGGNRDHDGEECRRDMIEAHGNPYKRIQERYPSSMGNRPVYVPVRIECLRHGVKREFLPWKDGSLGFHARFNNEVAYLSLTSPKSVVAQYAGINWRTVGECFKAAHSRLEPDLTKRFVGLKRICVDEMSYRKDFSCITVVYDMGTNRGVWLHEGHGKTVFKKFADALTEEQRNGTRVVTGAGPDESIQLRKNCSRKQKGAQTSSVSSRG